METFKRTPQQLFNMPQHFLIPLFQRPYVWKEEEQWEPLWKDIRRVAELRIDEPRSAPQHFLGAVVLQAHEAGSNRVTTWNVIDGQQRLTTLQLLMDASSAVFAQAGFERYANQLEDLTHNSPNYVTEGESRLKLRHLNNDHEPFNEVMTAEAPVDYPSLRHGESRMAMAHEYFTAAVTQWLGEPSTPDFAMKAEQLAHVLQGALQLVTIELMASENSQEIFETLNARGTPLTAADLVRNFVFQRLEAEGADTKKAYREDWPFETKFWTREVSVGRYLVSRSSLFLNQWLISRLGEEISPQSTFTRFKSYVEHQSSQAMVDLLPVLKTQAEQYEAWTEAAARPDGNLSVVETAVYRMRSSGTELLKPLLLWLHEPGKPVPQTVVDTVIGAAESWVIRRQLLRLSGADLGRIIADLIRMNLTTPAEALEDRVIRHLTRLNVTSTYWPGDAELRMALATENAYRRFPRARLRSYLEAVENSFRAETKQPQVERAGFPIEHILPQKWKDNWPVTSLAEEEERQARVHRLGNLTLLTRSLNSQVSNGPWTTKRRALLEHNTLKLTGRLVERTDGREWDEELIDQRTVEMIEIILRVWSVPQGHEGAVVDPQSKVQDWVEIKHLVGAGFLAPGDKFHTTHRDFSSAEATVMPDGHIDLAGKRFTSPSGAAYALRKKATNGWRFWSVADGRRLHEVRAEFMATSVTDEKLSM